MPKDKKDSDQDEKQVLASPATLVIDPAVYGRFNVADKTFVTEDDVTFKFRSISPGTLDRTQMYFEGIYSEPTPPIQIIDHGKGRTSERRDTEDLWYLKEHSKWFAKVSRAVAEWVFTVGIEVKIPSDAEKSNQVYAASLALEQKELTADLRKFLYINSVITSEEYKFIFEAIVGQAGITQKGLQQAEDEFPDKS